MKQNKNNQFDFVGCFHAIMALGKVYTDIAKDIKEKLVELLMLFNTLRGKEDMIYVGHECGIPHTATDFGDCDENDIPKTKVFEYIGISNECLTIMFEDGTKSVDFAIDDLAYLLDDISSEIQYLAEEDGLLKKE